MTTILVQALCVLMLLLFAAMALYPLFLGDVDAVPQHDEDRVISIAFSTRPEPTPLPVVREYRPIPEIESDHPTHRPAA